MKLGKPKKCQECKEEFTQSNSLTKVCSIKCAISLAKKKSKETRQRDWKKKKAILKDQIKTRKDYMKELQPSVNKIARIIDKSCPCISCGKTKKDVQYHGGHFYSTGARPSLRFNLMNIFLQCSVCNNHLSANLLNYELGLINTFGKENSDYIKYDLPKEFETLKLTEEELKNAIPKARAAIRMLEKDEPIMSYNSEQRLELRRTINKELGIYGE
jgi:hypothetical protein